MLSRRACGAFLLALLAGCGVPTGQRGTEMLQSQAEAPNPVAMSVNAYRQHRGLAPIPVSLRLTQVAAAHVADLEAHYRRGTSCNMHSWSANGSWTPCCYTPDHARKECMWNKPSEITGGAYSATGYEIVAYYSDPITPERALQIWQQSDGHHIMILNRGQWYDNTWRAMGAAIGTHYAVVWFGEQADRAGD